MPFFVLEIQPELVYSSACALQRKRRSYATLATAHVGVRKKVSQVCVHPSASELEVALPLVRGPPNLLSFGFPQLHRLHLQTRPSMPCVQNVWLYARGDQNKQNRKRMVRFIESSKKEYLFGVMQP